MQPTEWTIREAIQANIETADPLAVVWLGFVLDVVTGENANLLKPTTGADSGKIHGWMIGDPSETQTRKTPVRPYDDDSAADATGWKIDTVLTYPIWFFHFYHHPDSTETFSTIRDAVVTRFANHPRLGIAGETCAGLNQVYKHRELQAQNSPDIVSMGGEWAHWLAYELVVELYRTPTG